MRGRTGHEKKALENLSTTPQATLESSDSLPDNSATVNDSRRHRNRWASKLQQLHRGADEASCMPADWHFTIICMSTHHLVPSATSQYLIMGDTVCCYTAYC